MLLTIDPWQDISRAIFMGTFRHPLGVVSSLVGRSEAWGSP